MKKPPCAILVDGYLSTQNFVDAFRTRGIRLIHVQSGPSIPDIVRDRFFESGFEKNIVCYSKEALLKALQQEPILCVIAGSDLGIALADFLSKRLGLKTNGTQMSHARRNKFQMGETLKQMGIATANQILTNKLTRILQWVESKEALPIVLKPEESIGAEDVFICNTKHEVEEAFFKILGQKNALGGVNQQVLVQEFIQGTEYIVNTFSVGGQHFVSDLWECDKAQQQGGEPLALMERLLPFDTEYFSPLSQFSKRVLDHLQIQFGPGHLEIVLTHEGPVLIEMAPRIHGSLDPRTVQSALGYNHIELTLDTYLYPENIIQLIKQRYRPHRTIFHVFLRAFRAGILLESPNIHPIEQLISFAKIHLRVKKGDTLMPTTNLCNGIGSVDLVHNNLEQLQQDYQSLRTVEKNDLLSFL